MGDDGAGADNAPGADGDAGNDVDVPADPYIIANHDRLGFDSCSQIGFVVSLKR